MSTLLNIGIVVALIVVEGLFVAAEISLVSLREGQVRALAADGNRRAQRVTRLVHDPNRFLAATQLGVTLTAIISSAFGAVTLSQQMSKWLRHLGLGHSLAAVLGFLAVTLIISFFTLVVGELVPKRLALQRSEGTALTVAPTLDRIATLSRPVIWVLSVCTNVLVRVLGGDPSARKEQISDEELRGLVASHESLREDERRLIDDVFASRERALREVMLPRTEVVFLDESTTVRDAVEQVGHLPHSRYPVVRGSADDVVGFVHVRDLLVNDRFGMPLREVMRPVKLLPSSLNVLSALSEMRREGTHLAIVVDEYGGTAGIVTLEDLIEEVVGDIRDEYDPEAKDTQALRNGEVEVSGLLHMDDFAEVTGVRLPDGPYETVAGYVMSALGHLPTPGESVLVGPVRVTVTSLDGRRVDRLRVTPATRPASDTATDPVPEAASPPASVPGSEAVSVPPAGSGRGPASGPVSVPPAGGAIGSIAEPSPTTGGTRAPVSEATSAPAADATAAPVSPNGFSVGGPTAKGGATPAVAPVSPNGFSVGGPTAPGGTSATGPVSADAAAHPAPYPADPADGLTASHPSAEARRVAAEVDPDGVTPHDDPPAVVEAGADGAAVLAAEPDPQAAAPIAQHRARAR